MGSANLALVFGPTLTRAPDSVDPRQLHNDVPSINVLIQLCIDHHEFLFGPEEEEGLPNEEQPSEAGISPDMLSTSPPSEPPSAPSSAPPDKVWLANARLYLSRFHRTLLEEGKGPKCADRMPTYASSINYKITTYILFFRGGLAPAGG